MLSSNLSFEREKSNQYLIALERIVWPCWWGLVMGNWLHANHTVCVLTVSLPQSQKTALLTIYSDYQLWRQSKVLRLLLAMRNWRQRSFRRDRQVFCQWNESFTTCSCQFYSRSIQRQQGFGWIYSLFVVQCQTVRFCEQAAFTGTTPVLRLCRWSAARSLENVNCS